MTIIQPNKNNNKINLVISILTIVLVVLTVWGVFLYNRVVDFRHETRRQKDHLRRTEVANAELKNRLYEMTDAETFESALDNQALILEKNPKYLKSTLN